jgi:photosystem II stability/assembly factor-like uncharacterized protein
VKIIAVLRLNHRFARTLGVNPMPHDVFISYSSEDKAVADSVVAALEQNQIRCWYAPRDIKPGADWGEEIAKAINVSSVFLLIFSSSANRSQRVLDELNLAILREVVILPFRIEKLDPSGAMLLHLSSRHWLDAFVPSWEKHLDSMVNSVSSNLGTAERAADVDDARSVDQPSKSKKGKLSLIGIAAAVLVVALAAAIGIPNLFNRPETTPTEIAIASMRAPVLEIESPTPTIVSSPTPIPLAWTRLSSGQTFSRDTITAIVIDPDDPEVLYVGTDNAGIYKSIDGGVSWKPANNGLGRASIDTLVMDVLDPRVLYTGTLVAGVFKTTDSGGTWHEANSEIELPGWDWTSIVRLDPQDDQHLYYTNGPGIYESLDGAGIWGQLGTPSCPDVALTSLVLHPSDDRTLYAASYTGDEGPCDGRVSISQDGGHTWTLAGLQTDWIHFGSLHIDSQEGSFLFASTWPDGLYGSSDGGATWDRLMQQPCSAFAFSPDEATVAYCVNDLNLLRTADGGQRWKELTAREWGEPSSMLVSPHTPGALFVGGKGLYLSIDDGSSWLERNSGLGAGYLEMRIDPTNNSILYVEMTDGWLYQSSDAGHSWRLIEDERKGLALDASNGTLYRAAWEYIIRSKDKGETWQRHGSPEGFMEDVEINPVQSGVMYSVGQCGEDEERCIYISSDGGNSWQTTSIPERGSGNRIVIDPTNGQRIYVIDYISIYRSFDGGETWRFCANPGGLAHYGSRMAIDPQDSDRLFLATRGEGVSISEDGCLSWQASNEGLGNLFVNTVAVDPVDPDTIYAGTDGGAYVSFNGGESWGEINDGLLGAMVVYSIVVDPVDPTNVYAATPLGIFELEGK